MVKVSNLEYVQHLSREFTKNQICVPENCTHGYISKLCVYLVSYSNLFFEFHSHRWK